MSECAYCDNNLSSQQASYPESIICYKAGIEDPKIPGNRIVTEWVCPVHGTVLSPGGGISIIVILKGGPWDGKVKCWGVPDNDKQIILTDGKEWIYEWDHGPLVDFPIDGSLYTFTGIYTYVCKGEVCDESIIVNVPTE